MPVYSVPGDGAVSVKLLSFLLELASNLRGDTPTLCTYQFSPNLHILTSEDLNFARTATPEPASLNHRVLGCTELFRVRALVSAFLSLWKS